MALNKVFTNQISNVSEIHVEIGDSSFANPLGVIRTLNAFQKRNQSKQLTISL